MNQFDELKELLVGDEQRRLSDLQRRIDHPVDRAEDLIEILPDSIAAGHQKDHRLSAALQEPVTECVRESVRRDPQSFADALFPVIGPAIRKSINENLRSFFQSINEMLEQSTSLRGFRWRIESWRTGVPFYEIVLQHTLVYSVDQIFLIHATSGLLIGHVAQQDVVDKDADAVSAMLTAIQDFVRDAFSEGRRDELSSIDIGDQSVWLLHGSRAMLACVVRGVAPQSLREELRGVLDKIHRNFGSLLEHFTGDKFGFARMETYLDPCLKRELANQAQTTRNKRLMSLPLVAILLLLGLLIGYALVSGYQYQRRIEALYSALEAAPGIVVVAQEESGDTLVIRGLIDPIALEPRWYATQQGFQADELRFEMKPYQSLEKEIVVRRARRLLQAPDTIELEVRGSTLFVRGDASPDWKNRVLQRSGFIPGIDQTVFEVSTEEPPAASPLSLIGQIREKIGAPEGVKLAIEDQRLVITGESPWNWYARLSETLSDLPHPLTSYDVEGLDTSEWLEAQAIAAQLNETPVYFDQGARLVEDSQAVMNTVVQKAVRLQAIAKEMGIGLQIELIGFADNTGKGEDNFRLRSERAHRVRERLLLAGIDKKYLNIVVSEQHSTRDQIDEEWRRVAFAVSLEQPMAPSEGR